MKIYQSPSPRWLRRIAIALVAGLLSTPAAIAQSTANAKKASSGSIQGRVFNPASKEYVRNAEVRLDGTNRIDYTANDGSFDFDKVAPGPASVTITYTVSVVRREGVVHRLLGSGCRA